MDPAVEFELRTGMDRLRGRLFQVLESFGLPEIQEDAAKQIVRRTTYEIQADIKDSL